MASPVAWFRYTWDAKTAAGRSELLFSPRERPLRRADAGLTHRLWTDLRNLLDDPDLPGRWFGYFSYDLCRLIEPGKLAPVEGQWPLVELAWCPEAQELAAIPSSVNPAPNAVDPGGMPVSAIAGLASNFTRSGYECAVRRVLDYIAAGDVFQVNLAQRFATEFRGHPRELYARLAMASPAWYGAHLELPPLKSPHDIGIDESPSRAILSTSPELFLQVRDRHVITRPIKGTRPHVKNASRSHSSEMACLELLDSAKDTAELNMIVDLMRNDLGRVCAYRSIGVTEARTIETHPTVHHGVATLEGDLHESKDIVDLLKATLPGGSVTGAPKVRAMQIIDELEPSPRGPYCGAMGYISRDELQLSVAIRTMLLNSRCAGRGPDYSVAFSVGGGIVADSEPATEYEETLTKAQPMIAALRDD
jgi:anthranilate/para-aminobenzoate synthase component I